MLVTDGVLVAGEAEQKQNNEEEKGKTFTVTMEDMEAFADGKLTVEQFRQRAVING